MIYHKRIDCRLCGSSELQLAIHYPPQPPADAYQHDLTRQLPFPLDLFLCEACGAAQLLDIVSADSIYPLYTYETASSPSLKAHFKRYADDVISRLGLRPGSLVIDIGSNDGTLLEYFLGRGMRVYGVDPAAKMASAATMRGIPTLPYFFNDETARILWNRHGPAQLITANNVFANVDDLRGFTESVRNLLTEDGVFIFETFYLADLIDNMVFDFIYHEHVSAFAVAPLIGFFQRVGMELFDIERVPTKGGSIRCYVQRLGGSRKVEPIVAAMVNREFDRGLGKLETFKAFAVKMAHVRLALQLKLSSLSGKTIAGYGASPTSTTLIYYCGLGDNLAYLVDDWAEKQGTYSPGLHLPVYGPDKLTDLKPAYCLILAWRYADEIIKRNPGYRGTWIVPLPVLRLVDASPASK